MKKLVNKIPVGLISVIVTAIVIYLLLSPPSGFSTGWFTWLKFENSDKFVHAILFFFMALSYLFDYTKLRSPHHTNVNKELALTVLAASIGLLTETAQLAMGLGRTFEVYDIYADVIGAFVAFLYMHFRGGHILRKFVFSKCGRHHHQHHDGDHGEYSHETV